MNNPESGSVDAPKSFAETTHVEKERMVQIYFRGTSAGGDSEEVTPVPIPNTVVKLFSAHDTGISRESRTLPDLCLT